MGTVLGCGFYFVGSAEPSQISDERTDVDHLKRN